MTTASIAGRSVPGLWQRVVGDESFKAQAGDFEVIEDAEGPKAIAICCPGCEAVSLLNLRPGSGPDWHFDGDRSQPSLHPSINHVGCWHGWLTAGQFVFC